MARLLASLPARPRAGRIGPRCRGAVVAAFVLAGCQSPPYEDPSKAKAANPDRSGAAGDAARPAAAAKAPAAAAPKAGPAPKPAGAPGPAAVGTKAPDFRVRDDEGHEVALADFRGKHPVLLLFYPKDFTSGCTAEMSHFGAEHRLFAERGVEVFGVSIDPPDKHRAFRESLGLPFPLLADEDGAVSRAYGALAEQGDARFSLRKVVLIDADGVVAYRDESYRVGDQRDFDAVVAAVAEITTPPGPPAP